MTAQNDLMTNIQQVADDFYNIKQAIIDKGIEIPDGTKTSEYGNLINNIQTVPKFYNLSINGNYNYPFDMLDGFWIHGFSSQYNFLSTTNYININNANSWKICVHFKCSNTSFSKSQVLFGAKNNYFIFPSIEISEGGFLWAGYTTLGNRWESNLTLSNAIAENEEYCVTYYWNIDTPTTAIIELYNITQNIVDKHNFSVNGAFYPSGDLIIEFGGIALSSNHCAIYTDICLIDTYIEINNELVFGNKTNIQ